MLLVKNENLIARDGKPKVYNEGLTARYGKPKRIGKMNNDEWIGNIRK